MSIGRSLVGILVAVAVAFGSQAAFGQTRVAGDTMALPSDPKSFLTEVGKEQPGQADSVLLRALSPVADAVPWLTNDTGGKVLEATQQHYEKIANTSINELKKGLKGQSFKGETARAMKATAQSRSGFLSKLGTVLNVVDIWSTAWTIIGYAAEGDRIGVVSQATDAVLMKAAGAAGGLAGTAGGPAGSVVGVFTAQQIYQATGGAAIKNAEENARLQATKDQLWGPKMANGIYVGPFGSEGRQKGKIRLTLENGSVRCTVSGQHLGGTISGSCGGAIGPDGTFSVPVSGTVTYVGPKTTTTNAFGGTVSGQVGEGRAAGTFSTTGDGKTVSGTWEAPRM
jgi:hypothetical protein